MKNKLDKQKVFSIIVAALLTLAHIAVVAAVVLSYRYYGIYPTLFISIVAIVVCILIISDIIFFVGFNHKDLALKITTLIISIFILLGGTIGTYEIAKINGAVSGILSDGKSENYETYSGVFLSFGENHKFTTLEELKGRKIGLLSESTPGLSYIAKSMLDEQGFDYATVDTYTNTTELLQALITSEVDAVVTTSAYQSIFKNDENSNMKDYLDDINEFCPFEKELKVETKKSTKDLTRDPFNVLLIGWSRTDIGSTVGLADAIIVATINPKTYTVSMMSIARDSFVPIACYGGAYDKINSGRSTSRACFIETVEDFIGMDIDYYMEADYEAIVYMVNTLGGVMIDNPVDFELDGVFVKAGKYKAEGWEALEFCRERHHMPNGDFDRQKHQKEVILEIAKTMVEAGDINLALEALHNASPFMDTNFTLKELSAVFNLLLNTKNYTGLSTFDLVDFHTLRITGSGGLMYYSYSMHLPLWVYLIYQGSYDESINHIYDVMGKFDTYNQEYSFEFSADEPYVREPFYSLDYENKFLFTPDPMPAYWPSLSGMTLADAYAWADANGITLTIKENIMPGDKGYDESMDGLVCDQSIRYGQLVSENKAGTITVMGTGEIDEDKVLPNYVTHNVQKAIKWAKNHDVPYKVTYDFSASGEIGDVVSQEPKAYTKIEDIEKLKLTVKGGEYKFKFSKNGHGLDADVPKSITYKSGDDKTEFASMKSVTEKDVTYEFDGWYLVPTIAEEDEEVLDTTQVISRTGADIVLYAHWITSIDITLDANGGECSRTSITSKESLPTASKENCTFLGWFTSKEGGTKVDDLSTLTKNTTLYAQYKECEHTWSEWQETLAPTCDAEGQETRTCSKCGAVETQPKDKLIDGCEGEPIQS